MLLNYLDMEELSQKASRNPQAKLNGDHHLGAGKESPIVSRNSLLKGVMVEPQLYANNIKIITQWNNHTIASQALAEFFFRANSKISFVAENSFCSKQYALLPIPR